jgi:hypothetical protein
VRDAGIPTAPLAVVRIADDADAGFRRCSSNRCRGSRKVSARSIVTNEDLPPLPRAAARLPAAPEDAARPRGHGCVLGNGLTPARSRLSGLDQRAETAHRLNKDEHLDRVEYRL